MELHDVLIYEQLSFSTAKARNRNPLYIKNGSAITAIIEPVKAKKLDLRNPIRLANYHHEISRSYSPRAIRVITLGCRA